MEADIALSWTVWAVAGAAILVAEITQGALGFGFPTVFLQLITRAIIALRSIMVTEAVVSRRSAWFCGAMLAMHGHAAQPAANGAAEVAKARQLWSQTPQGRMLERILPPAITPAGLPEPDSHGAQLTVRYCVQCHHLPNPHMHTAERWVTTVNRMVWRMQGQGNMGTVMK